MAITRRKDGRAMQTVVIDGKRKTFYSSEKNDKKAEKDILNQRITYEKNLHHEKHNFLCLAEKMLVEREATVGFKAMECYYTSLKHLQCFYNMDLEEITPEAVQGLLEDLGRKRYSYSTVHKVRTVFGMVLAYGLYHGLQISDYRRTLKVPKTAKKGKRLSPDDFIIDIIVKNSTIIEFGMWPMMLLCTGYRRSELDALQKKAIDFDNNIIHFLNSVEFINNQPHLRESGKSTNSELDVPILSIVKPLLYDLVKDMKPDDFIFGGEKPLTVTQIRKRMDKYTKAIGYKFTNHQLRHAYAKLLYKAGVDVKTAQRLLRHADIQTTMNIYTEFDDEVTRSSVEKINAYTEIRFDIT
jgi:integrase